MTSSSRVCVAVPIFNGGPLLIKTLECLANQTHQNLIVHLFDNGSTDETPQVLEEFLMGRDPDKFRLFRSERPTGMVNDWNLALQTCEDGDYIKILPADDILSPECIEKQAAILDNYPEVGFVVSQKWVINQRGEIKSYGFQLNEGTFEKNSCFDRFVKSPINSLGEPGAGLMRRSLVQKIGNFDPLFLYYPDLDYWLRALRKSPGYYLRGKNYFFRIHSSSGTAKARSYTAPDFRRLIRKHGLLSGRKFNKIEEFTLYFKAKLVAEIRHFYMGFICK